MYVTCFVGASDSLRKRESKSKTKHVTYTTAALINKAVLDKDIA